MKFAIATLALFVAVVAQACPLTSAAIVQQQTITTQTFQSAPMLIQSAATCPNAVGGCGLAQNSAIGYGAVNGFNGFNAVGGYGFGGLGGFGLGIGNGLGLGGFGLGGFGLGGFGLGFNNGFIGGRGLGFRGVGSRGLSGFRGRR